MKGCFTELHRQSDAHHFMALMAGIGLTFR
jgi:hypothetical protein